MTVKLAAATFLAPVTYTIPGDSGHSIEIQFQARFKRLPKSERELLDKRLRRTGLQARLNETFVPTLREVLEKVIAEMGPDIHTLTDGDLSKWVLRGWQLKDAEGQDVPYDEATVAAVFEEWDGMETAIARGFMQALNPQAAEKNSAAPSPTTSAQTAQTTTSSTAI